MAPTRKTRSVNKRFLEPAELSPDKDVGVSNKGRQRKRKLCDMLGSQWSDVELQRFYGAYRKHGKDWKKVAGVLRNRTIDMVEALYNMNKAYLSLPEGTASVDGLKAMMTDHYHVLEGSGSDHEGNGSSQLSREPQKRGQGKVRVRGSKETSQNLFVQSNEGCLPFLPKRTCYGPIVKKRTPRIPVSYTYRTENGEIMVLPHKSKQNCEVDEDVARVAALALTEASQRGGSKQNSLSPPRSDHIKSSPFPPREGRPSQSDKIRTKIPGIMLDENGDCGRDTERFSPIEYFHKGNTIHGTEENFHHEDGQEAYSGPEGFYFGDLWEKADFELKNAKDDTSICLGKRKKSKKDLTEDESDALDALFDLRRTMPAPGVESGSSDQLKEETYNVDLTNNPSKTEKNKVMSACEGGDKQLQSFSKLFKKKGKSSSAKFARLETCTSSQKRQSTKTEVFVEKEDNLVNKSNNATFQQFSSLKQPKSSKPAEYSTSESDQTIITQTDSTVSTALLPTTRENRRKRKHTKLSNQNEMKFPEIISKNRINKNSSNPDKDRISSSLSSYMVRRWCSFEWFYSAIDYPWFANREFVEYLKHVRLGHVPRLTRVEWGVIRSSLGKPRRLSENFLNEEREKLKEYRGSVRKHYTELRAGSREGLPTDLARPLSVGQRVIALHPKSREVHDGSVLTVDHDRCRIQFDRPELGVEFVMDIDCMPSNPLENMPEASRSRNIAVCDKLGNGQFDIAPFSLSNHFENGHMPVLNSIRQGKGDAKCGTVPANLQQSANAQHNLMSHNHAREADIRVIADLNRSLDKKEAILKELKQANDDLFKLENEGNSSLKDSESYKKQYSMVLVQLKEASDQVSTNLQNLRQRNTHPANTLPPWPKNPSVSSGLVSCAAVNPTDNSCNSYQELEPNLVQIINHSRHKSQAMVDTAIQAYSSMREGEDAFSRIGAALVDSGSTTKVHGSIGGQQRLSATSPEPSVTDGSASGPTSNNNSDASEAQMPSDLITSCVATLLMIQTCTEGHYPPSDVAQILDSALRSLEPRCPENQGVYREIQMSMGRIKTQILALVPTQN